jgi:hypothetical protein
MFMWILEVVFGWSNVDNPCRYVATSTADENNIGDSGSF